MKEQVFLCMYLANLREDEMSEGTKSLHMMMNMFRALGESMNEQTIQ